jgi:hypothetical protein
MSEAQTSALSLVIGRICLKTSKVDCHEISHLSKSQFTRSADAVKEPEKRIERRVAPIAMDKS